jgi:prolyl-tRNA synthetase
MLAPTEVVIVPIWRTDDERARVFEAAQRIKGDLAAGKQREGNRLRVHVDAREGIKPGAKYFEWELRGVPVRLELGPRDLDKAQAVVVRRDTREKRPVSLDTLGAELAELLEKIQGDMFRTARDRREANSLRGNITYDRFREVMTGDGAFVYAGWCGDGTCEAQIKDDTKATIRVLPDEEFRSPEAPTRCMHCARPATIEALWAKAY